MRRLRSGTSRFLIAGALAAATLAAHDGGHDWTLTGGLWWNGTAFDPRTVHVVDGVFRDTPGGVAAETLDLAGRWVVPPFADAHNHQLAGEGPLEAQLAQLLAAGVFALQNPNNLRDNAAEIAPRVNRPDSVDVRYAHGGLTGRGGHPAPLYERMLERGIIVGWTAAQLDGRFFFFVDSAADLERRWPEIVAGKPDFLKIYLERSEAHATVSAPRGLDPALAPGVVRRAHAAGLRVAAHVRTSADFRAAVAAGVDQIHHLPLGALSEADGRAVAAAGVTVVPTFLSHRPTGEVADLPALYRATLQMFERTGVRWALGPDNAHLTAVDEFLALDGLGAVGRARLLAIATGETPRLVLPERRVGCLAAGCEASFLALAADPLADAQAVRRIALAMKQGRRLAPPSSPPPAPPPHAAARH